MMGKSKSKRKMRGGTSHTKSIIREEMKIVNDVETISNGSTDYQLEHDNFKKMIDQYDFEDLDLVEAQLKALNEHDAQLRAKKVGEVSLVTT